MRNVYLVLSILGAVIPVAFFMQFFSATPAPGLEDFIPALFVNGAAGGFSADLLIASFVFWLFMWNRRDKGPELALFIGLNLCIGLSCALPAYLYTASGPRYVEA